MTLEWLQSNRVRWRAFTAVHGHGNRWWWLWGNSSKEKRATLWSGMRRNRRLGRGKDDTTGLALKHASRAVACVLHREGTVLALGWVARCPWSWCAPTCPFGEQRVPYMTPDFDNAFLVQHHARR